MRNKHDLEEIGAEFRAAVRQNWAWYLAGGLALALLGVLAIGASVLTSFVTIFFLGTVLLIGGAVKLIYSFWIRDRSSFFISLLLGLFYVVMGLLFLAKPVPALAAITLLIGSLFVVGGLFKVFVAISSHLEYRGWIFFSGIISLLLGALILVDWPAASLWVVGLFVGIDLLIYGWSWVALSLAARK